MFNNSVMNKLFCSIFGHDDSEFTLWSNDSFLDSKELLTFKCSRCGSEYYYSDSGYSHRFSENLKNFYVVEIQSNKMPSNNISKKVTYTIPVLHGEYKSKYNSKHKKHNNNFNIDEMCEERINAKRKRHNYKYNYESSYDLIGHSN